MSRLPIRVRVAAAFAVAMAIVLAGTGLLIYERLGADLSDAVNQDLRLRAQDQAALVGQSRGSLAADPASALIEHGESFAQLLDSQGRVVDATRSVGDHPLLDPTAVRISLAQPRFFDRRAVAGLDEPARLLATAVDDRGRTRVLVVGATLENRAEALRSLRDELVIAGPLALVLATALGYLLAGAGLRTVEAMRERAAAISAERPGERLPVPASRDELERLGTTLNEMLARLEAALDRERGFVAEAGHELRTPLALLRAELDYALHYADSADELRAAIRTASEETDRLVQLASDLLLIATADQGRLPLRLEQVEIHDVLDSVRARFAWRAEADGRRLEIDAPAGLAVTADRLRLEQALGNLVDNALRHGLGTVTLHACADEHSVELHVRDQGAGFPEPFLPQAFQRFSRPDDSRTGMGAGLGLAIVATIASAHQGTAAAANGNARGADVQIRLPRLPPDSGRLDSSATITSDVTTGSRWMITE